jgi:hypothetical protein
MLSQTSGLDALFAERYHQLRPREPVFRSSMATDGRSGSIERHAFVRTDYGLFVRYNPEGPLAEKQRRRSERLI